MDLQKNVTSIMTSQIESVSPDQLLVDLKHIYEKSAFHHHIPVVKDDHVVGMVSLIDFMRAISYATLDDNEKVYQTIKVSDIMSSHPVTLEKTASVKDAVELLSKGEFSSVVITDQGKLTGIVTNTDLVRLLLHSN
ncbi:MAG: HPP family protein [Bacteroidota bacterium]|jgi:acetoin utilization protein AcuB